jgi:hypothetical protein
MPIQKSARVAGWRCFQREELSGMLYDQRARGDRFSDHLPSNKFCDMPVSHGSEFRLRWTVILAAGVGVGLGVTGLPIYTTGEFILPLGAAFGWSRSAAAAGLTFLTAGMVAKIYSWVLAVFSAGIGIGPVFAGWTHDRFGSYSVALETFAVMLVAAAIVIGGLGQPEW